MNRPTVRLLARTLPEVDDADYSIVIFTGHGYMDADDTIIELKGEEKYNTRYLAKSGRTLILDCYRRHTTQLYEVFAESVSESLIHNIDLWDYRKFYEAQIAKCEGQRLVFYSCSEGEISNDNGMKGGFYSYNLLKVAKDWYKNNKISFDPMVLSMVQAHNETERILRYRIGTQTPQIEKPRTAPYYPLAVII